LISLGNKDEFDVFIYNDKSIKELQDKAEKHAPRYGSKLNDYIYASKIFQPIRKSRRCFCYRYDDEDD